MYSILFSSQAEKDLNKLDKDLQRRILDVLERIRIRPHHFVVRVVGGPYFRVRVGDYRIILDIQNDKLIIIVLEIGHRSKIYK